MKFLFLIFLTSTLLFSDSMSFDSDKKKHLGVSFLIGTATGAYMDYNYQENSYATNLLIGTSLAMVPGVIKEIQDDREANNKFSSSDIAYDFLGALAGNLVGNYISKNFLVNVKEQKIAYNIKF